MAKVRAVLIVEDEPDDVELIVRVLRENDPALMVVTSRNGVEALEYLESLGTYPNVSGLPAFILLDLSMPKMGGLDFLREIRSRIPLLPVPVIVFTSSKNREDVAQCYLAGANSYINKPQDYSSFKNVLNTVSQYWVGFNVPA